MKAFLVNPYNETIVEVDDDFNNYKRFYHHLSEPGKHNVSCFCTTQLSDVGDVVFLDDEGFLSPGRVAWTFRNSSVPLAGRGIVVGTDDDGDVTSPSNNITLEFLKREVVWLRMVSTGDFGRASQGMIDHPVFGKIWQVKTGLPVLAYPTD